MKILGIYKKSLFISLKSSKKKRKKRKYDANYLYTCINELANGK